MSERLKALLLFFNPACKDFFVVIKNKPACVATCSESGCNSMFNFITLAFSPSQGHLNKAATSLLCKVMTLT